MSFSRSPLTRSCSAAGARTYVLDPKPSATKRACEKLSKVTSNKIQSEGIPETREASGFGETLLHLRRARMGIPAELSASMSRCAVRWDISRRSANWRLESRPWGLQQHKRGEESVIIDGCGGLPAAAAAVGRIQSAVWESNRIGCIGSHTRRFPWQTRFLI